MFLQLHNSSANYNHISTLQPAHHRTFKCSRIIARRVIACEQQVWEGSLLRWAMQVRRAAEGGALLRDDLEPLRLLLDAEFFAQFGDSPQNETQGILPKTSLTHFNYDA